MPRTASQFAEFVFLLKNTEFINRTRRSSEMKRKNLRSGIIAEQDIDRYRSFFSKKIDKEVTKSTWKVIYNGQSKASGKRPSKILKSSSLMADNEPISCSPDIVFQCSETNSILIVERKVHTRRRHVPNDAWMNVQAQLWCYAWIDDWLDIPDDNVYVVSEHFYSCSENDEPIFLKTAGFWQRSDPEFNNHPVIFFSGFNGILSGQILGRSFITPYTEQNAANKIE